MSSSRLDEAALLMNICHQVYQRGYAPGTSGNISLRSRTGFWATPTGACLGDVTVDSLVDLNAGGLPRQRGQRQTSEWHVHEALYRCRPDVGAVIHAHPPTATALAAAHKTIDSAMIAEVVLSLGTIPLVPYAIPGSPALAEAVTAHAQDAWALLLANHGVIALGKTLKDAWFHLEMLESLAEVYILSHQLPGGPCPLSAQQVAALLSKEQPQEAPNPAEPTISQA